MPTGKVLGKMYVGFPPLPFTVRDARGRTLAFRPVSKSERTSPDQVLTYSCREHRTTLGLGALDARGHMRERKSLRRFRASGLGALIHRSALTTMNTS